MKMVEDHVIVLAAGRGRRLGGPKALMDFAGKPWWMRQADQLEAVGLEATWVVSDEVRLAIGEPTPSSMRLTPGDAHAPMFESLLAGVESLRDDPPRGVFALPVDVPAARAGVWRALSATGRVAVPVYQSRRGHPIYLPWRWVEKTLLRTSLGARPEDHRRLDKLIRSIACEVEVADEAVIENLNIRRDVESWLARHGDI